jgi:NitT/TauT family transport system permease protein
MVHIKLLVRNKKYVILSVLFWIIIWQAASMIINKEMLLASPFAVMSALFHLIFEKVFWSSILNSFLKITLGFCFAILFGVLFAVLSYCSNFFRELISPLIKITKATPVASFIILALLWIQSDNLSVLISFLMVLPVIYTNVLQGLNLTNQKLLEMAKVFRIGLAKKIRFLYIPAVMPYFVPACSLGLGFCWKSGIAAEVIGLPKNSIGEKLYEAKLYLMTKELFAWTIVIILISVIFERLVIWVLHLAQKVLTENVRIK